jgi:uncharacterized protein YdbL (DUF1318 family)
MKLRASSIVAAAATLLASPAIGQSPQLAGAIAAGQVGERYDGYMGFATTPSPEVRRQVDAIDIRRRNLYTELGMRRNVTAGVVGLTTGCSLLSQLPAGEAYMLKDGVWRRRGAADPAPIPDYCR